jgi:hypothetical protein
VSIRGRLERLEQSIGLGRLWDGIGGPAFLRTRPFGPAALRDPDPPDGARRAMLAISASVAMCYVTRPDRFRGGPARAARARELVGASANDPPGRVAELLLARCQERGFGAAELELTRRALAAQLRRPDPWGA